MNVKARTFLLLVATLARLMLPLWAPKYSSGLRSKGAQAKPGKSAQAKAGKVPRSLPVPRHGMRPANCPCGTCRVRRRGRKVRRV